MSDRDKFEKWANSKFASIPNKERGLMWRAWQAARAQESADKPEGEWVDPEDRLPEDESTRLALVNDYDEPMVVPVRYSANSEQWFDVENVDRDGDQNTLYGIAVWREMPAVPDMGGEK